MNGGFFSYFVNHRTAANLLMALALVAGLYGAMNLRAQFFPDIINETVTVTTTWEGAGATDLDEGVVDVLEPALKALNGVEDVVSVAQEGSASITLTFVQGWDMGQAADDAQAAVDGVDSLPSDAEDPRVRASSYSERVVDVVFTGGVGLPRLEAYADELATSLFGAGIAKTTTIGAPDTVIMVEAPEAALIEHNLTLREISTAITADVTGAPSGDVDAAAARVRAGEDRRNAEQVGDIVVRRTGEGSELRVRDVAALTEMPDENSPLLFRGGEETVVLRVQRNASGDAIAIERAVVEAVDALRPTLPADVELRIARSRVEPIKQRRDMLIENGITGLALVLVLLFLFLSARTAFWVAAGIPISIAATLAIMYASGQTLNMISMFGLIISLGIIVDDAIVVGEHADALARKGIRADEAAIRAARRMSGPVFSASITTVIAFAGLMAISGRFGALIGAIPFVVCAVIVASLIESFLILPAHMRHALENKTKDAWYDAPSRVFNRGFRWVREHLFRPFARWVVKLRYLVIASAVGLFLFSASLFGDGSVTWRFFSAPERGTVTANFIMRAGATRDDTLAMLNEMDRALTVVIEQFREEHGVEPVEYAAATFGDSVGWRFSAGNTKPRELLGGFEVSLIDEDLRPFSTRSFSAAWAKEINQPPRVELLSLRRDRAGPGGDAIDVKFTGADAFTLKAASTALIGELSQLPGVGGLDDTLVYDKTELVLTLTPRGQAMGFDTASLGRELRSRLSGIEAAEFARDGGQVTVEVRAPRDELGANLLTDALVRAPSGVFVSLSEIADVTERQGFASIRREDGVRVATVTGEVVDDPATANAVEEALSERILPAIASAYDVSYTLGGLKEQERDFMTDAGVGFLMCLAGIYLTLTWIFSSWARPFVVMLVIPLGIIGAIWGHYWFDLPLSMFSVVGLIGMAGIIINDSIVLVTAVDEHAETRGAHPSIVDGTVDRFRAVLLTTLTTVGGLIPLLFETSRQALFLKPTVITLVFGLGFGVVLVLLVTPALLAIEHDIRMAVRSFKHMMALPARRRRERFRQGLAAHIETPDRRRAPPRLFPQQDNEAARSAAE